MSEPRHSAIVLEDICSTLKDMLRVLQASAPPPKATDADLDGKYGDPVVKLLPRDWHGNDYRNCKFSETEPAFLDQLASMFDYFATRDEESNAEWNGKPTAPYKRKDAARARGWAKRLRDGWKPADFSSDARDDGQF